MRFPPTQLSYNEYFQYPNNNWLQMLFFSITWKKFALHANKLREVVFQSLVSPKINPSLTFNSSDQKSLTFSYQQETTILIYPLSPTLTMCFLHLTFASDFKPCPLMWSRKENHSSHPTHIPNISCCMTSLY